MRRRHDPFLKRLYRAGTRDALTLFFPDLAARLDWDHWQWIDKEIPILGKRRGAAIADLVGETRDREGRYLKVLIHPELQMTTDDDMDWRVFEYNTGLLLQEGHPGTRVLTIVFYHCPGTEGIRERQFALDFYEKSLHQITYWSVGLGELEAEAYAAADNPMGWALASWMRQEREGRVELRLSMIEKILRFVRDTEYQGLLLDTVQTYYKLSMSEQKTEEQLLRTDRYREVEEMAQTVMERREARARREGQQEGRQEGEELALQRAVKRAILTRFPAAPASLTDRMGLFQEVTALEELLSRVILASSLEEIERLLAGPPTPS
jgi:predicted transposase/invertase (TIGR01784 family)